MPLRVIAVIVGCVVLAAPACIRHDAAPDPNRRVSVYVLDKLMPVGMLVGTATTNGTLTLQSLPADVAGDDALSDTSGLECLVAGQSLPRGTVARRKLFVPPGDVGLTGGLTGGTGERPAGC